MPTFGTVLTAVLVILALAAIVPASAQPRIEPPAGPSGPTGGPTPPPPPPPPPSGSPVAGLNEPMWVAVNGQATGPFEPAVIAQKIARREIIDATMVYTNSIGRWVRAGDVPALQPLLRQAQAGGGGAPPSPPVPPPSGDAEAIQRISEFMVGEWLTETPGLYPGITVRTQTRYLADGTFRGTQTTLAMVGNMRHSTTQPLNGRWSVQPIDARRFILTLTGSQLSGSVPLEIMDQNHLRNTQDNYVATRVGR